MKESVRRVPDKKIISEKSSAVQDTAELFVYNKEQKKVRISQGRRTGWKLQKISNGQRNWKGWICFCIRDSLSFCFRASGAEEEKRKCGSSI